MQPRNRHVPPSRSSRSTMATRLPSCDARRAAEYPPVPAPITTTSNASTIRNGSLPPSQVPTSAHERAPAYDWLVHDDVELKRTPLEAEHARLGAKMGAFAG